MARYALVIGISRYDNFRNLDKAATDAAAIARILQTHGQYQVEPLPKRLVEAENRWELATDKKLTEKDLGQALETFLLERAKDQEALIYFAGHGFEVPGLGRRKKGYIATSDCTSDGRNAILFSDLNDLIRESSLSNLVLILDCCHAGSFLERTMLESTLTAFKEKKDYYLITACRSFERAREGEEHGIFTAAVLNGLQRDNADSEGTVTGDRLFDFVQRELRQSGQEPIRVGIGRSLTLVVYPSQNKIVTEIDENIIPYRGLEPFEKEQAEFFFGRQQVVEDIWAALDRGNFATVIGASGSGKSSAVRAGLIPWLEASDWQVLKPIKPGIAPLAKLAATFESLFQKKQSHKRVDEFVYVHPKGLCELASCLPDATKFLLVVDQFEEVFTLSRVEERQRFIDLLTQVAEEPHPRLAVVTTMRADFLESCLQYSSLTQLIQTQAIFMPPLTGGGLEQAVVGPAKRLSYSFEPGLLGEIFHDIHQEPGYLPLLQFALLELWERRDRQNRLVTRSTYREIGGVLGVLNHHAEQIYQRLNLLEQAWVKRLCLMLVQPNKAKQDTRQRRTKRRLLEMASNNLDDQQDLSIALQQLIDGRLLVIAQEKEIWVDLAHEALMEKWKRFACWRQEHQEVLHLADRVEAASYEWLKNQKNDDFLMPRGMQSQVRERWSELEVYLDSLAKEFYEKSTEFIELSFPEGIQPQAFTHAFKMIREEINTLVIKGIEKRNYGDVLVKVSVPSNLDKTLLGKQFMKYYEKNQKILSGHNGELTLLGEDTTLVEVIHQSDELRLSSKSEQIIEVEAVETLED